VSTPAPADTVQIVVIRSGRFDPDWVEVDVNTTVMWSNRDDVPHTVTSLAEPPLFDRYLEPGKTFGFLFTEFGTYQYHCKYHHTMQAAVIVVP
jgi:plastocyanin